MSESWLKKTQALEAKSEPKFSGMDFVYKYLKDEFLNSSAEEKNNGLIFLSMKSKAILTIIRGQFLECCH